MASENYGLSKKSLSIIFTICDIELIVDCSTIKICDTNIVNHLLINLLIRFALLEKLNENLSKRLKTIPRRHTALRLSLCEINSVNWVQILNVPACISLRSKSTWKGIKLQQWMKWRDRLDALAFVEQPI